MSSSTRTSYLVQLVTVLNNFIAILFLRSAFKNRFNKAYISTRFSPNPAMYYLMKWPSLWGKAKEEEVKAQPVSRKVFIAFFGFHFLFLCLNLWYFVYFFFLHQWFSPELIFCPDRLWKSMNSIIPFHWFYAFFILSWFSFSFRSNSQTRAKTTSRSSPTPHQAPQW